VNGYSVRKLDSLYEQCYSVQNNVFPSYREEFQQTLIEEFMYLINEVSQKVNLSQKRIREYEKEGFIKPLRAASTNNRLYSDFDVDQIRRINYLIHRRGFTLACLRNLLAMAPCWNVFDCERRTTCPAFKHPHQPCWQVREFHGTLCPESCERCAVFLNRHIQPERVLEKTPDSWETS